MAYSTSTTETKPAKLSKKDENEILTLLDDYFQTALDDPSWKEAREEMIQCFDYKENRQWTKAELAELAARGQPATVHNQVKITIDRIVGQFVQVKTKTTYKPRNGDLDSPVAEGMSDIYTYIRQTSGLEYEERDVVEDGATGGFGVFEVCIDEAKIDDPMGGEVHVKAEDCFNVFPDPRSRRYDWNEDARFICRAKWVDAEYLKDLYPEKKAKINGLFKDAGNLDLSNVDTLRGETYLDYKRERVRLVECQYKKMVADEETGDRKEQICVGVFTGGILFEHGQSKRKRFSFVPFFQNRKKNGAPISSVFISLPLQDEINKRASKAVALLTMNQATYEKGAIADKDDLRIQMVKPDGIIEIEEGFAEKFKMDKNLELAQSQNEMHVQSLNTYRLVTGINPDALGEKSEVRSGVGIQRKVAMTGVVIAPFFDNFKRTRESLAKTIHDAVTVAYTGEKVLNITDNPKLTRSVILSNEDLDAIKQTKYDVIISEEEDYDTVQEQQQDMLMKNLPAILQFGPAWGEVLFEISSIRNKDEILQKVQQLTAANAPRPEPNASFTLALDKATLPEKLFYYQKLGMPPELLQMLVQEAIPPTQIIQAQTATRKDEMEAQAEVAKTQQASQTEALKRETEQAKAQAAREKSQMDILKAQMDIEAKREEIGLKGEEMRMKLQGEQQKMAVQSQQIQQKGEIERQKGQMQLAQQAQAGQQAEQAHKMAMKGKQADIKGKSQIMKQQAQAKKQGGNK